MNASGNRTFGCSRFSGTISAERVSGFGAVSNEVIDRILREYGSKKLTEQDTFYRIRKNLSSSSE